MGRKLHSKRTKTLLGIFSSELKEKHAVEKVAFSSIQYHGSLYSIATISDFDTKHNRTLSNIYFRI